MLDPETSAALASLDQRVQRLEDAVSALQDTHLMEERVLDRLAQQRPAAAPEALAAMEPSSAAAPSASSPPTPNPSPDAPRLSGWAEIGAIVRMFFDIHYHIAWTTRLLVLLLIPLILTSHWWFPPAWVYGIGFLFDKALDVILAFVLYKVLVREARRYVRTRGYATEEST